MSDGGLHIGELAARSQRSVHAIRWYESQGLMPGVARDAGGRRVYQAMHLNWLDFMDRLRRTGMSIAEMRDYTALVRQGRGSLRQRMELLQSHRERAQATVTQWLEALALIDGKIAFYDEWLATGQAPALLPHQSQPEALAAPPPRKPGKPRKPR